MRHDGNKTGWRKKGKYDAVATGPSAHPTGICGAWVGGPSALSGSGARGLDLFTLK